MGPTSRGTWKARERQASAIFGAKRQRCSGSSGREDCSRSDSTHDRLFIETKLKASSAVRTLFDQTKAFARAEKKVPLLMLADKGKPGFLVVLESSDLPAILAEYAAAEAARGDGDGLEGLIRKAFLAQRAGPDPGPDVIEFPEPSDPPPRAA